MKITKVEPMILDLPFEVPFKSAWRRGFEEKYLNVTVVRIFTDEGITGTASAEACFGWGEAQVATVQTLIGPQLIGKDPFATEELIKVVLGKAADMPIYKMWGGAQERVLPYAAWGELRPPEKRAEDALALVEKGFKGVKIRLHHREIKDDLAVVEEVRKAVGDRIEIIVDANQASARHRLPKTPEDAHLYSLWSTERAVTTARELEKLDVLWLEEPLDRYDFEGLKKLTSEVDIWIAGGELNRGLHEYKTLIMDDVYDVIQANCTLSEGMFQLRKVAGLAEMCYKLYVPHAWIPGSGFAASLQLAASIPNCPWIEYPYDPPSYTVDTWQMMLKEKIVIDKDGYLPVPQKPGLGVDVDEEVVEKYRRE
jgi:L-alanine-DL-glutamate epimerase-like enolase superfamily enzyme